MRSRLQTVVINMDETAIRFAYDKRKGTVAMPSHWSEVCNAKLAENLTPGQAIEPGATSKS